MSAVMQENTDANAYQIRALKDVKPDPNQPRKIFDPEKLQELADSIKANGVMQPIVVRIVDGKPIVFDGERRYQASKLAKAKTIPTIVRADPDEDGATILIRQVAANEHEKLKADGNGRILQSAGRATRPESQQNPRAARSPRHQKI